MCCQSDNTTVLYTSAPRCCESATIVMLTIACRLKIPSGQAQFLPRNHRLYARRHVATTAGTQCRNVAFLEGDIGRQGSLRKRSDVGSPLVLRSLIHSQRGQCNMSVDNQSLRQAVRLALMTSAIGTIATPALAQDSELNEVVVTGSRIVRPDYQSASPIVTVSEQNFRETGSTTVETMLNTLPQFVPSVTNTSNNPSNNGQANMELRGLGIERTDR